VILSVEEALRGWPFVARRLGLTGTANEAAARAALDAARMLAAGDASAEPAAVFFALASYRRAFPGAWREMALMLAIAQARIHGRAVDASGAELHALARDVMHKRVAFDEVRRRFAGWLVAL
jgi:hypothetical protein